MPDDPGASPTQEQSPVVPGASNGEPKIVFEEKRVCYACGQSINRSAGSPPNKLADDVEIQGHEPTSYFMSHESDPFNSFAPPGSELSAQADGPPYPDTLSMGPPYPDTLSTGSGNSHHSPSSQSAFPPPPPEPSVRQPEIPPRHPERGAVAVVADASMAAVMVGPPNPQGPTAPGPGYVPEGRTVRGRTMSPCSPAETVHRMWGGMSKLQRAVLALASFLLTATIVTMITVFRTAGRGSKDISKRILLCGVLIIVVSSAAAMFAIQRNAGEVLLTMTMMLVLGIFLSSFQDVIYG